MSSASQLMDKSGNGMAQVGSRGRQFEAEVRLYLNVKRFLDVFAALVLLVLTAPLLLLAMALIKLTSRGPALYTQTRLGLAGRPFTIVKLRTMAHECESLTGARW